MRTRLCTKSFFIALAIFLIPVAGVTAQSKPADTEAPEPEQIKTTAANLQRGSAMPPNAVSCFDYYTFGSVQADISAPVQQAVSGSSISFSGKLTNDNAYPIIDGALYVKVFKSRGEENDGNGPDVVDAYFVKGGIMIPAKGTIPIQFQWKVPSNAQSGDYELATFFTTSNKFNLLGLSFTDDVVGNSVPFSVSGEVAGGVMFDKSEVSINKEKYHFAAFPPREDAKAPVTVEAKVINTTGKSEKAKVTWRVYQWDAQLRENLVAEESRSIPIGANSSQTVSYTVSDAKYPVYYVVGTLEWRDTRSIIGARFVRMDVDRTRINFPGLTVFPLEAGQENTLFSCLHNEGTNPSVSGGRLELTLEDKNGQPIAEYTYSGDVTSDMMGVMSKFTPKKPYDYVSLHARLYHGSQFVDEANLVYDCKEIDPALCLPEDAEGTFNLVDVLEDFWMAIVGVFVLCAILVVYASVMKKDNQTMSV